MLIRRVTAILALVTISAMSDQVLASLVPPDCPSTTEVAKRIAERSNSASLQVASTGHPTTKRDSSKVPSKSLAKLQIGLVACSNSANIGQVGGSSGGLSSGADYLVASHSDFSIANRAVVVWLCDSRWLDIPMPPCPYLLRPPQVVCLWTNR